ncbi:MAG: hypothetical protein KDA42_07070 [Planctomycetales bacterium]|nr:hypothetical protein [Planctomycetales bacterium]
MAIAFEELEGSPTIEVGGKGAAARREFRVAWTDWRAFAESLIGGWKKTGTSFRRVPGLAFPGLDDVFVEHVSVRPFSEFAPDGSAIESLERGVNAYPTGGARVTVDYESIKTTNVGFEPAIEAGTYLTYTSSLDEELVVTPSSAWVWTDDDSTVPDSIETDLRLPLGRLRVGWHFVPLPPWTAIRTLRGRVNDASFFGAPAGTLQFLGARIEQKFSFLTGPSIYTITYDFSERTTAWNNFFKPGAGFTEISHGIDGATPYAEGDFGALFEFAAS